jgi:hypothetical protein
MCLSHTKYIHIVLFWVTTQCFSLVDRIQDLGETHIFKVLSLKYGRNTYFSETLLPTYQATARSHNPGDHNANFHHHAKLKSCKIKRMFWFYVFELIGNFS